MVYYVLVDYIMLELSISKVEMFWDGMEGDERECKFYFGCNWDLKWGLNCMI